MARAPVEGMRPIAIALRLAPVAAAAFFSLATFLPIPVEPLTCDPVDEPFTPAGLEVGPPATSDAPDSFLAWKDGDPVAIQSRADDAVILYRLRVVGSALPECVRQVLIVSDASGAELGRLDAALAAEANGSAAQLTFDAPVQLSRWPASGETLTIEATVGETTTAVVVTAQ
jgi:hypothetical protein